jgi:hypothetical protein
MKTSSNGSPANAGENYCKVTGLTWPFLKPQTPVPFPDILNRTQGFSWTDRITVAAQELNCSPWSLITGCVNESLHAVCEQIQTDKLIDELDVVAGMKRDTELEAVAFERGRLVHVVRNKTRCIGVRESLRLVAAIERASQDERTDGFATAGAVAKWLDMLVKTLK